MTGGLGIDAGRIAETALRTHCGFIATLRMAGLAVSGGDADQLGLGTPVLEEMSLGPAVWRRAGVDTTLLIGAGPVAALVGSTAFASAEAMFEAAAGVVCEGLVYTITKSEPITAGGAPCGYRLNVVAPARA